MNSAFPGARSPSLIKVVTDMLEAKYLTFGLTCLLWSLDCVSWPVGLLCAFALFQSVGAGHLLYLAWHTMARDARGAIRYLKLLSLVYIYQWKDLTVAKVFSKTVKRYPNRSCLLYENSSWSFLDLEKYSNQVAHYLLELGCQPGDCIALFMENRPEYVGIWLGCSKVGVVPALINSHLQGISLVHSIRVSKAEALIYGAELSKAVHGVSKDLKGIDLLFSRDGSISDQVSGCLSDCLVCKDFDRSIRKAAKDPVPESVAGKLHFSDKLLYIYTSGTTGSPKAAVIKHSRFYFYACGMYYMGNVGQVGHPIVYDPLPLYHSAGGILGIGIMLVFGATVVVRKKFSVRNFWKDCVKYNCNVAQYIGETCRYLLSAPEIPEEKLHTVKIIFGNGLRPKIWDQFSTRFGISKIYEFYGATEGNSTIFNIDSKPGYVGFSSVLLPYVYPVRLIKVDQNGEVIRDPNTKCAVICKPGETGEFVGKIVKNSPSRGFDGYVDEAATEKRICRNVLRTGDVWFRSGDLLNMDEFGWIYFVDRMGDTYKWKGENVSTNEVEAVLSNVLKQQDTIVYGVKVPGVEGRAGMAAIVEPSEGIDLKSFLSTVKNHLPGYATPVFLRFVQQLDITGTFKIKKMALQREGFDPKLINDQLFFYDVVKGAYRQLDACLYNDIVEMRCKL